MQDGLKGFLFANKTPKLALVILNPDLKVLKLLGWPGMGREGRKSNEEFNRSPPKRWDRDVGVVMLVFGYGGASGTQRDLRALAPHQEPGLDALPFE